MDVLNQINHLKLQVIAAKNYAQQKTLLLREKFYNDQMSCEKAEQQYYIQGQENLFADISSTEALLGNSNCSSTDNDWWSWGIVARFSKLGYG